MKLSVITPTCNSSSTIEDCVMSIINQNITNFEHIIVDNLSSDNTLDLIKSIYHREGLSNNLRIICERDKGIADAFNKGISVSNSDIVTIINSDDYYVDSNLFKKVLEILNDKHILFTHGDILFVDEHFGTNLRKPLLCSITVAMPYNHPTMFFRKEVYTQYGFFDTNYKFAMDFEFICRLSKAINDFENKGCYLSGKPLVGVLAGGASWKNELDSIEESKQALKKHGFWNANAKKNYTVRVLRTKIKNLFNRIHANAIVKLWRKIKWHS